jgi:hypothetical protein
MAYPWQPKAVVMDKSDATRLAAKAVWPESKIVLCRWHALRAVEEFCRPQMQHHTALIKYQLSYLMRSRTPDELAYLVGSACSEGQLQASISRDDEKAIVHYFLHNWLENDRWKEASIDCFTGSVRCGGTNMHIESFFRHSKEAFGGSRVQRKREFVWPELLFTLVTDENYSSLSHTNCQLSMSTYALCRTQFV